MKERNIKNLYKEWLESKNVRNDEKEVLLKMTDKDIDDAFSADIEFGTGGMRGKIGPGTNRINFLNVRRVTVALAVYIKKMNMDLSKGVVISYDNRLYSRDYAFLISKTLNDFGINSFVFNELKPTPELSFAVRKLKCLFGIMITASHNPKTDNGYKLYNHNGTQLIPSEIKPIIDILNSLEESINLEYEIVSSRGKETILDNSLDEEYISKVKSIVLNPSLNKKNFKIVYSPNHGASLESVLRVLKDLNYEVYPYLPCCTHDSSFPNVPLPNPEEACAFIGPIKFAKEIDADLILMNDPDGDRVGIAYKDKNNEYVRINGNQSAAILLNYILSTLKERNELNPNMLVIDTIVTSNIGDKICEYYNVKLEKYLTGFKYIGNRIDYLESINSNLKFIFGYEESDGCLINDFVRDKDGTQAILLYAECALYYHLKGMNLGETYSMLESKFGHYKTMLFNSYFEGSEGSKKMQSIMSYIRNNPLKELNNNKVRYIEDYLNSIKYDLISNTNEVINIEKSNVIKIIFENGSNISIRPSGTEPKCKFYIELVSSNEIEEEEIKEFYQEFIDHYKIL